MACSLELLNWFENCYAEDIKPVTTLTELKQSKTLKPNWKMLPTDIVNIILQFIEQFNIEFYTNAHLRIDTITNSCIVTVLRFETTWLDRKWYRFIGTPPIDVNNKYVTTEMVLHKQSLPFSLMYITQELEKRNQKSVDGNIKPSKMKCKYIKNIVEHTFIAATSQYCNSGRQVDYGCSPNSVSKYLKQTYQENIASLKSPQ